MTENSWTETLAEGRRRLERVVETWQAYQAARYLPRDYPAVTEHTTARREWTEWLHANDRSLLTAAEESERLRRKADWLNAGFHRACRRVCEECANNERDVERINGFWMHTGESSDFTRTDCRADDIREAFRLETEAALEGR